MSKQSNQQLNLVIRWGGTLLSMGIMIYLLSRIGWQEAWQTVRQLIVLGILFVLMFQFVVYLDIFNWQHKPWKDQAPTNSSTDSLKADFSDHVLGGEYPTKVERLLLQAAI